MSRSLRIIGTSVLPHLQDDERVARAASGADLLVHEVAIFEPELLNSFPSYREIQDHHSSPEEAGRILSLAKPKRALIVRTRTAYRGPLVIGHDLMSFVIEDAVQAFDAKGEPMQPLLAGK